MNIEQTDEIVAALEELGDWINESKCECFLGSVRDYETTLRDIRALSEQLHKISPA